MIDDGLMADMLRLALRGGGEYADVFAEWRSPTGIRMDDGKLDRVETGVMAGVAVRVIFGARTAMAVTNDFSPDGLREAARALASGIGKAGAEIAIDLRRPGAPGPSWVVLPPDRVPLRQKAALVMDAERAARAVSNEVTQATVVYRDSVQRVKIASSGGALVEDERVHTVAIASVVARRAAVIQSGSEPVGGSVGFELFETAPLVSAAERAAQRAVALLDAPRVKGGRMPVVIGSEAGGTMIHEAIGHGLEADLAGRGLSKFSGRLGRQVASPLVTVMDDPTMPGKRGSYKYDDEGTPGRSNVLVEAGVLRGYMSDRLCAMRDGVPATGNGRRESYRQRPIPRMTNTFIAPGASDPSEILRSTERGLYVRKMGGGQVNTVTGDFVFDVLEGYVIEGGRLGHLVRGATLTGNGPEVLMHIDMVGTDLGFSIGTCGKDGQGAPVSDAMPTVRIPEIVVGGEV